MEKHYFQMDHLSVGYNKKALIHDICIGIEKEKLSHSLVQMVPVNPPF